MATAEQRVSAADLERDPSELPDKVTPDNIDDLSDDEIAYLNQQNEQQREEAIHKSVELSESEENALEVIAEAREEETGTHTVQIFPDVEVEVRDTMPGRIEKKVERAERIEDASKLRDAMLDILTTMIVDDDEAGEYDFQSRAVWEAAYDEHGSDLIMDKTFDVLEPAMQRAEQRREDVESFRPD